MIIKSFYAQKVYGYLDFAMDFNSDISFITGGNGSGKTTALKLINALLVPNFGELLFIPFKKIKLTLINKSGPVVIEATLIDNNIHLLITGAESPLVLESYGDIEQDLFSPKNKGKDDLVEEINRRNADHPVVKAISSILSPVFLGLERKREDIPLEAAGGYYYERERASHSPNSRTMRARRLIRGSLGISLMETEFLVQDAYRRMRSAEETYSTRLRDSILLSAFQYTEFDYTNDASFSEGKSNNNPWLEKGRVLQRKTEIKDALSKIGINDKRLSTEVDTFFDRLSRLFENMEASEDKFNIEVLTNKAQIERITKVVEIIDEHKSKIDRVFKPINSFLTTINKFYNDSNKTLAVDTVGQLVIERPDGKRCTIESLSSGERQLLVIFAHAFFNRHNESASVFIIDEPELSLHLRWQEKFAETILGISPNSQFIMATHSPEILGQNKNKAIKCR